MMSISLERINEMIIDAFEGFDDKVEKLLKKHRRDNMTDLPDLNLKVGDKVRAFGCEIGVIYEIEPDIVWFRSPEGGPSSFYPNGTYCSYHTKPSLEVIERVKPDLIIKKAVLLDTHGFPYDRWICEDKRDAENAECSKWFHSWASENKPVVIKGE